MSDVDAISTGTSKSSSSLASLERPACDEGTGSVFFADLTDAQFLEQMVEAEAEARHLNFENEVFFRYLEGNDPPGYQEALAMIEQGMFLKFGDVEEVKQATKVRSSRMSLASIFSVMEGRGPRVNLVQKSDMVLKAIEEMQAALELFLVKSHRIRRRFLSEIEEFQMRELDITSSRHIFEYHIVIEGVDRTQYMKLQYRKVSAILERRKELSENLQAVDFDKLEIENKNFCRQIDSKMVNVMQYVNLKKDHAAVVKQIKIWQRKKNVLDISLRAAIREMMNNTGSKKVRLGVIHCNPFLCKPLS
nr:unnamed protein product [Callosobruchus analis]